MKVVGQRGPKILDQSTHFFSFAKNGHIPENFCAAANFRQILSLSVLFPKIGGPLKYRMFPKLMEPKVGLKL